MMHFCSLYSGSSGNALFVKTEQTKILIDAGLSGIKIINALASIGEDAGTLDAILITHEHSDHIQGAGILSRKFDVPIYANCKTWDAMDRLLGKVVLKNIRSFRTGTDFQIKEFNIHTFQTPHDAAEPVGFSLSAENRKITVATDLGYIFDGLYAEAEGSDLVLIEANHDVEMLKIGGYPWPLKQRILSEQGHLSNDMAGEVVANLTKSGVKQFLLGHLSGENNFPELALQTVSNVLFSNGIRPGQDVLLDVLSRSETGQLLCLT